jgi:hypothetical protein
VGSRADEGSQYRRRQVAWSGDHSIHRWGQRICSRGKGAQGGRHLPKRPVNAPRSAGSERRRQRRWRVQGTSGCRTPKGQGVGVPRGSAVRLILPRHANAEGTASAGHPPGRDLRLVPAARGASTALCSGA